jgi:hypothetical protein
MAARGKEILMRRALVLTALTAFAALGAGCGASEISPEAAVAEAATKTSDAGTSRVSFSGTLNFPDIEPVGFSGDGVFVYKSLTGRFTYDLSELPEAAGLPNSEGWIGEVIMADDRFFMRLPALTRDLPEAKPWIEIEIKTESGLTPSELAGIGGANDPARLLQFLQGASGEVNTVGEEQVRGVDTTRYRATVELARVIEKAPEDARTSLREQLERREQAGLGTTFDMEVWIDEDGLARRIRQADPEGDITMDLYDFGIDVDVEPPPSDQVMTEEELDRLIEESE